MTMDCRPDRPRRAGAHHPARRRAPDGRAGDRRGADPDEVLALGREVGIPGATSSRRCSRSGRGSSSRARGLLDGSPGRRIAAQRVVRGEREAIEAQLIRWLEQNELLSVQRHQPGRITWEPIGGFQAAYPPRRRGVGRSQAPDHARARRTRSRCHRAGAGAGVLQRRAHRRRPGRRERESVGGGAALATAGAVGSGVLVALGAILPVALIPLPLALGLGLRHAPALRPGGRPDPARPGARARSAGARRARCRRRRAAPAGRSRGCWTCWPTRCGRR